MSALTDDADDRDSPAVERDAVSGRVAADSADWHGCLKGLPRYAAVLSDNTNVCISS